MSTGFKRSATVGTAAVAGVALVAMVLMPGAVRAQQQAGKAAFERVCAGCHGAEGAGDAGPPLVPFTRGNRELLAIVREGSGQMPAISSREVSDEEVAAVADYLRSLSAAPRTGGALASATAEPVSKSRRRSRRREGREGAAKQQ